MKVGCRHGDNNVSLDMLKQCEPCGCQHEHDDKPKEKYIDHCRKDLSTKQNSWRLHVYFEKLPLMKQMQRRQWDMFCIHS